MFKCAMDMLGSELITVLVNVIDNSFTSRKRVLTRAEDSQDFGIRILEIEIRIRIRIRDSNPNPNRFES